jgi:hypothetical protein
MVYSVGPYVFSKTFILMMIFLSVFENRLVRRKIWPKADKVTGGCRELHIEKLHNFYSLLNILAYFSHFGKMKGGLCDLHAACVSVYPHCQLFNG